MCNISGKGAHLTAVPIQSPDSPVHIHKDKNYTDTTSSTTRPKRLNNMVNDREKIVPSKNNNVPPSSTSSSSLRLREQELCNGSGSNNSNCSSPIKNGCCTSSRENLLTKTDVAMASLLVRLDQVAAQCNAAQTHGGGRFMCEDKFQVIKLILYLRAKF